MQNYHYRIASEIMNEENVLLANMIKAQVHAILAVADLVNALIEITVETRKVKRRPPG